MHFDSIGIICLFICLFVHLFVYLFIYLFIELPLKLEIEYVTQLDSAYLIFRMSIQQGQRNLREVIESWYSLRTSLIQTV